MAIDKELFYASHGLKYPVVARPYTDDYIVTEKMYTKADMVAMLEDLDLQIDELAAYNLEVAKVQRLIRDRIDKLKENKGNE